jgi:hypothetical protein
MPTDVIRHGLLASAVQDALRNKNPTVRAVITEDMSVATAIERLQAAGVILSRCKRYHLRKWLLRARLPTPTLLRREVHALRMQVPTGLHPMFDAHLAPLWLRLSKVGAQALISRELLSGEVQARRGRHAASSPSVVLTIGTLDRGSAYDVQVGNYLLMCLIVLCGRIDFS